MNNFYNNLQIMIEHVVRNALYHFMYLPALAVALVSSLLGSSVCCPGRRYLLGIASHPALQVWLLKRF